MALVNVSASVLIRGVVKKDVWNVISNFINFSEIVESVDEIRVTRNSETQGESEWFLIIDGAPLNWVEEDFFDENVYEIKFESISGDFESIKGLWSIKDCANGCVLLLLDFNYNLGIPVIEEVIGDILKEKVRCHINTMLSAVKLICDK